MPKTSTKIKHVYLEKNYYDPTPVPVSPSTLHRFKSSRKKVIKNSTTLKLKKSCKYYIYHWLLSQEWIDRR